MVSYDNGFIMLKSFNSQNAIDSVKGSCNLVLPKTFTFSCQLVVAGAEVFVNKNPSSIIEIILSKSLSQQDLYLLHK